MLNTSLTGKLGQKAQEALAGEEAVVSCPGMASSNGILGQAILVTKTRVIIIKTGVETTSSFFGHKTTIIKMSDITELIVHSIKGKFILEVKTQYRKPFDIKWGDINTTENTICFLPKILSFDNKGQMHVDNRNLAQEIADIINQIRSGNLPPYEKAPSTSIPLETEVVSEDRETVNNAKNEGFFSKKIACALCGNENTVLERYELANKEWICSSCYKKCGYKLTTPIWNITAEQAKLTLEQRQRAEKEQPQSTLPLTKTELISQDTTSGNVQKPPFWRRIFGFRSASPWKMIIAGIIYLQIALFVLVPIIHNKENVILDLITLLIIGLVGWPIIAFIRKSSFARTDDNKKLPFWRKIYGFRSGSTIKMIYTALFYLYILLFIPMYVKITYFPDVTSISETPAISVFSPSYSVKLEDNSNYANVVRKVVKIVVPTGLSKKDVELNLKHAAGAIYKKYKPNAVSVFAYCEGDDIADAYTVGMCDFAPDGKWENADKQVPVSQFEYSIETNDDYFKNEAN